MGLEASVAHGGAGQKHAQMPGTRVAEHVHPGGMGRAGRRRRAGQSSRAGVRIVHQECKGEEWRWPQRVWPQEQSMQVEVWLTHRKAGLGTDVGERREAKAGTSFMDGRARRTLLESEGHKRVALQRGRDPDPVAPYSRPGRAERAGGGCAGRVARVIVVNGPGRGMPHHIASSSRPGRAVVALRNDLPVIVVAMRQTLAAGDKARPRINSGPSI